MGLRIGVTPVEKLRRREYGLISIRNIMFVRPIVILVSLLVFLISASKAEELPSCAGEDREIWTNCQGTLNSDNFHYIGDFAEGKPHGDGLLEDAFGTRYKGQFRLGNKDGRGEMTFGSKHPLSGSIYVGQFKDDVPHGQGVMQYLDGAKYEGAYQFGQFHGHGSMKFTNGDHYRGGFREGKKEGFGIYTYVDGARYEGRRRNAQEPGRGRQTYASGGKYVGNFQNGAPNGEGVYTFSNGASYKATWVDGEPLQATIENLPLKD